jgi:hypothetical protein
MIIELEKDFEGKGEVKGMKFHQLKETDGGFIYEIDQEGNKHYEVFRKKLAYVCIDFEKKIWSDTDFKTKYPKSDDFGQWAWTAISLQKAEEILEEFCK